ncbi:tetratricopeptide repeat protein [Waterburya agarophytonicola K14]|uniref:non-specific serine/threonine protein kinase n=1 Tax=Waterburya agarophytonicola KI4 TaxID=2874699 RepID=A0A964BRQ3_9CYAN|nr:tetratricopeptide repeat protein [Waterburya agarophytonicola]MCC0177591.1 tetratricopeptide repeat protein [Waterburya agarophytonicola KI4]
MPTPHRDLSNSASKIIKSKKIMHVPGSIVGNRYQIIQKLGREETSKTYLAKDLQATGDARCALEQLNPNYDNEINWELIKQHLIKEVDVLERLGDHPQIPQFYNYFIENQQFYLVREYIDGDNLETTVERKLFNEVDAIYLVQDVLRILDFIHKTNVIHRDVQPIHLIKRKQDNSFVLIDFGAIREIESTEINLKGELISGKSLGNLAYVAPEQKVGQSHFKSDIYALARSTVYALTGRSPQEMEEAKISWQTQCQISLKLQGILEKMMSPHLDIRYSSALDVLQDLRPLLRIKQVVGGRYLIASYLGGKSGVETYLADNLHRQYQSPCLIKQIELPNIHGSGKVKIERRFAEELSILERLGYHDQIPQLWDHFEENEEFYLVQEYIQGENLAQKIEQQNLSTLEVVRILASSLSVLNFIHQNRIIHRNIKPSNLMIRSDNRQVVITDFGILMDIKNPPNVTIDSSRQEDKSNYWSPEQIAGRPTINSDLYALGMSAIEALTNIKPATIVRNKQTGKLLWAQNLQIDRRLVKIIDKMIDLDLGQRYPSAEKALRDLQKINVLDRASKQPRKSSNRITNRLKTPKLKIGTFLAIGILGVICLLGSIEFAFPTVRPIYYWYRGNSLLPKEPQAALDIITKAIDLKPESTIAWSGRGDALYSLQRYPEALEAYAEAARLDKTDWQSWKKQGDTLYKLERFPEAIALYDRALALEKDSGQLYNHRGKALYELTDYESALMMQQKALEIDRLNAVFLSDLAKNLIKLGKYYDALTALNRVQVSQPYNMKLWQDKAIVLEALNRPQEVAQVDFEVTRNYNKILKQQPQNQKVWLSQGDFFAVRQMYSQAIQSYQQAVKIQPNFYQGWLALGKTLAQTEQNESALSALDRALDIRPNSYLAWQAKGLIYQNNQNNLTQAIASYDRAIAIESDYAPLWRDLGLALSQQGNYTQAIESLTKAAQLASQDFLTWKGLATAWDMTGEDKKALSALDRAIKLQPQDPVVWNQKGQIYTKNAQYDRACDIYRQSLPVIADSSIIMSSMRSLGCRMN